MKIMFQSGEIPFHFIIFILIKVDYQFFFIAEKISYEEEEGTKKKTY